MRFDITKLKNDSNRDYEKAWLESKDLLDINGNLFELQQKGKSHVVQDFICDARKKMLSLGFEELILPMFVEEKEVYKQYGPEAALILDRLFYLAGLPRPDIGVSKDKLSSIQSIVKNFNEVDELKKIFREYKTGEIEADDLIENFVERLQLKETEATLIIENVFPELKSLKPIPTKTTLRSHTTALWFIVLSHLLKKKEMPLQYFSICPKFRREQKIDTTHLYSSNTLSLVVVTDQISLNDCKKIASQICEEIGFKNNRSIVKKATSKYYAPQTEFEIFVEHPISKEWIEIGDGGFYSPVSLAQYDIGYPVFNIGFGVERICMIKQEIDDIRKLVYPYFYEDISFSDDEIKYGIKYNRFPITQEGLSIMKAIIDIATKNKDVDSPVEVKAWSGKIKNQNIEVFISEEDSGVKLLGPACLNKIWIKDGNILGFPFEKTIENGVDTEKTYLEGIAAEMAYEIEIKLDQNIKSYNHRVKMCYRASEVNLSIDDAIMEYIHSKQKKIDIRGPVFLELSYRVIE